VSSENQRGLAILLVIALLFVGAYAGYRSSQGSGKTYTSGDVAELCAHGTLDSAKFFHSLGDGELRALEAGVAAFATSRCVVAYNQFAPLLYQVTLPSLMTSSP
jgi:hypothetical protein